MRLRQWVASLALGIIISATQAWGQKPDSAYIPDIEIFMQIGANAGPQVSRDGTVRCFASPMSGVRQLYRMDPTGWPTQLTLFPDGISSYALSYDGRSAVAGSAVGGSEQTNLYLIDIRTGRFQALTDLKGKQIADPLWSDDDSRIYYRSNEVNGKDFHVYEMDIASRKTRPVFVQGGFNGPAVINKDGTWLVTAYFPTNVNSDLYLVNLTDGKSELITPHEGDAKYESPNLAGDGQSLYLLSDANTSGIMRRARLDLKSKKLQFLDTTSMWEAEGLTLSDDKSKMAWIVNEDGYARLKLLDLKTNKDLPVPPLDGMIGSVSFDGPDAVVFTFSSPADPADCWRWNYRTQKLEQWTYALMAGIDKATLVRPQLVKFPSFDSLQISGFLYLPPGSKKGSKIPFIMEAHGGPESQFRPGFVRDFQYLVLNGYGIMALNPRGSSGYGREFVDMDNYKNRWKSVKDYETAARWLITEGYADPGKIAITGGSYGGFMTLAALTTNPDLYAAGIDEVGIANFVTFLKNTAPYRRALRESEYGPLADSAFLLEISPITHVDRIRAPLLIIHGANDPRVPVGEARQMAKAIADRGGIVDTLIFPDEGHGISKRANRLVSYRRIVDFLNQQLMGKSPIRGTGQ
jgi:dipeptidyl aminopeptidase/acylaminoacyl peptidase